MQPGKIYGRTKNYVCDCEFEKREFRNGTDVTNFQSGERERLKGLPVWRGRIICAEGHYLPNDGFLRNGDMMHKFIVEDRQTGAINFSGTEVAFDLL